MDDASRMAEVDATDELVHDLAYLERGDDLAVLRKEPLQIVLCVLEDQMEPPLHGLILDIFKSAFSPPYLMMLGCDCSSFRILISRIAVAGMPSSYCYSFIFFIATTRPVC